MWILHVYSISLLVLQGVCVEARGTTLRAERAQLQATSRGENCINEAPPTFYTEQNCHFRNYNNYKL